MWLLKKKHAKVDLFGNGPGPYADAANPITDRVFGLKTLWDMTEMEVQVQSQYSILLSPSSNDPRGTVSGASVLKKSVSLQLSWLPFLESLFQGLWRQVGFKRLRNYGTMTCRHISKDLITDTWGFYKSPEPSIFFPSCGRFSPGSGRHHVSQTSVIESDPSMVWLSSHGVDIRRLKRFCVWKDSALDVNVSKSDDFMWKTNYLVSFRKIIKNC